MNSTNCLSQFTGHFGAFMGHGETKGFFEGLFGIFTHSPWPIISLLMAIGGIFLAYLMYGSKRISAERIGSVFKPVYTLFLRKYYFDELYENIIVKISLIGGLFAGLQQIDTYGVDGTVNGVANETYTWGTAIRRFQTGQLQLYGLLIGIGVLAIIICLYIFA